jgi:hypothetical protein
MGIGEKSVPNLLTLKKLTGIHFVDKGAAISPHVLVVKRASKETQMSFEEILAAAIAKNLAAAFVAKEGEGNPQQLLEVALQDLPEDKRAAIMAAVAAMYQAMPPPAAAAAPAVPKADEPKPDDEPKPAAPAPEKMEPKPEDAMAKAIAAVPEEHRAVLEKALKGTDKLEAEIAKRKALEDEVQSLSETVAKSTADTELAEQLEIAKTFKHVKGDFKKRAAMLLALKKSNKEAYEEMLEHFKSSDALIKKALNKTEGTSRFDGDDGGGDDVSAKDQLEKLADDLVQKSIIDGKEVDFETAFNRVVKANKGLYVQMVKDRRSHPSVH